MKIRIELQASAASPAVHALVRMADALEGAMRTAVLPLIAITEAEDSRGDVLCAIVGALEFDEIIEGEVESASPERGEDLDSSLEGDISFELEAVISSRRAAKDAGNSLLDLLVRLSRLELTLVTAKLGRTRATLEQVAAAIIGRARQYGVELRRLKERDVDDDTDDDDETDDAEFADPDDDDDDADDDDDDEDDDHDDDDDASLDDEGFPAGGWGPTAAASSGSRAELSADELLYLEVAGLSWPCSAADVHARLRHALAKRHPDPIRRHNPSLADRYEEEYKRLQLGHDTLMARCGAGRRAG